VRLPYYWEKKKVMSPAADLVFMPEINYQRYNAAKEAWLRG